MIGPLRIDVPRDRDGGFDPLQMPKHERHFAVFEEKIVSMYGGRIDFEHAPIDFDHLRNGFEDAPSDLDHLRNGFEDAPSDLDHLRKGFEGVRSGLDHRRSHFDDAPSSFDHVRSDFDHSPSDFECRVEAIVCVQVRLSGHAMRTELRVDIERDKASILITQHGLPSAYLVDVETYELKQKRMPLL